MAVAHRDSDPKKSRMTPAECRFRAKELRNLALCQPHHAEVALQLADGWDVVALTIEILDRTAPVWRFSPNEHANEARASPDL
jgi:hypothetical protein